MKKIGLLFSLVLVLLFFSVMDGLGSNATEQLRFDVDRIVEILNDKNLDRVRRDEKIVAIVKDRFDFQVMSQWILGLHWRRATEEERSKFIDLFTLLLENTYVGRIETYTGEYGKQNVRYAQEQIEGDRAMVNTFVVTSSAEIPVSYKMIFRENQWRVYDVVIEEVSLVRNYRTTYADIIGKEGFRGLFQRMEEKIAELKKPPVEGAK